MHSLNLICAATLLCTASPIVLAQSNAETKEFAIEALSETLGKSNPDAVDTYFSPEYIQHNPMVADSLEGFGAFMGEIGKKASPVSLALLLIPVCLM